MFMVNLGGTCDSRNVQTRWLNLMFPRPWEHSDVGSGDPLFMTFDGEEEKFDRKALKARRCVRHSCNMAMGPYPE